MSKKDNKKDLTAKLIQAQQGLKKNVADKFDHSKVITPKKIKAQIKGAIFTSEYQIAEKALAQSLKDAQAVLQAELKNTMLKVQWMDAKNLEAIAKASANPEALMLGPELNSPRATLAKKMSVPARVLAVKELQKVPLEFHKQLRGEMMNVIQRHQAMYPNGVPADWQQAELNKSEWQVVTVTVAHMHKVEILVGEIQVAQQQKNPNHRAILGRFLEALNSLFISKRSLESFVPETPEMEDAVITVEETAIAVAEMLPPGLGQFEEIKQLGENIASAPDETLQEILNPLSH